MDHFSEEDNRAILRQQQRQDEIAAAVTKAMTPAPPFDRSKLPASWQRRFYNSESLHPRSDRRR